MASFFHNVSAAWMPSSTSQPPLYSSVNIPSVLSFTTGQSAIWLYTTVAIILALLALEQSVYRYKKAHLPGDKWTIPIIGKFADSVNPSMQAYKKQWSSGDLSAVSVFNMYANVQTSNHELF
jgi:sterol 22-desaturase